MPVVDVRTESDLQAFYPKVNKTTAPVLDVEHWPVPAALGTNLPPVLPFTDKLLPTAFRGFADDIADRMQVPLDFPGAVLILSLAGAVNGRAIIQPKMRDSSWYVVPNLWGAIVALPGYLKSPVIDQATRPLVNIQRRWHDEYKNAYECYALATEEHKLSMDVWRQQVKRNKKANKTLPPRPDDIPLEPRARRLIVNDATVEALHQIMADNTAGVLLIRDELTGWVELLGRPGREGERAFALEAWNGTNGFTVDRIGRGSVHVPRCCMSLLGGIQPARLRSYLVDALADGPADDGLIQRFQVLVWPDTPRDWTYVDRQPDSRAIEKIESIFARVVELDAADPPIASFSAAAQEVFIDFLTRLEVKVRSDELHPALISHLSKYRSLMPALALLFEIADADGSLNNTVNLEHAEQAVHYCTYLESHAHRLYSCIVTKKLQAARELARRIRAHNVGHEGFFTARDVYSNGWSHLSDPDQVQAAAELLEEACWIRPVPSESPGALGRGRPSIRFYVNPRVYEL